MFETEVVRSPEEPEVHTTVLDAHETIMSLGEAYVLKLAMQIWEELEPDQQREISDIAYTTCSDLASGERYSRELLIFMYVNRAPGEPFNTQSGE